MTDYKQTLNLPETAFPMKANLAERELLFLKKWQDENLYAALRKKGQHKKKFILLDGPPYANGHIHVGHAVNKILKDIIIKYKNLCGFDAPFVPGWDCHGLPIELNVEKKLGKPGRKVSFAEFRLACRGYALSQMEIQREEFLRLGVLFDIENPYLTMDFKFEANIIRSLAKIIERSHVEKGYKPVYWCLECGSALAEAEVEYADKQSLSIDVRFRVVDTLAFYACFDEVKRAPGSIAIPIWTTTPWTLPANEAVALNPDITYVLVAANDEQLLIAEELLPQVLSRYQITSHEILGKTQGKLLEGILLTHPFFAKEVPVVLGSHVTLDAGTGAVHTAPAHGIEDYAAGQQYQLPLFNPVALDGTFKTTVPHLAGQHVNKAAPMILDLLIAEKNLIHQEAISHSYPHCWRHKTPLIFMATPQWFVSMKKNHLQEKAIAAISEVNWIPAWGKARISAMMENRPDWCISRQRTWCVPLSIFVHKETGELHPKTPQLMECVAKAVELKGIEAWYELDIHQLLGDEANHYRKAEDTLDVWFDSGVVHECVLRHHPDLTFPADMVLEGSDQHRGWFNSMLLTSLAMNDVAPYRAVLTHGFVVDAAGRKMSKSLGNVISPLDVTGTMGADILRLWTASVDYRYEINASKEILTRTTEVYRRIRNTARFLLANLHDFYLDHLITFENMLPLDQFIVDKAANLQRAILDAYESCQFHIVVQLIQQFCVTDLGSFYLDIIKDRQYTMAKNSRGRRSAQSALFHIAHAFVRWLAPILSFTAEEIASYLPDAKLTSIFLSEWYVLPSFSQQEKMNHDFFEKVRLVRNCVNKEIEEKRKSQVLGSALEAKVFLYADADLKNILSILEDELRFVLITSFASVDNLEDKPEDAIATEIPGLYLKVVATTAEKCVRCWHRTEDVNQNIEYAEICGRCVENITGAGETRKYA